MSNEIDRFPCPGDCGRSFPLDPKLIGRRARCKCGAEFLIPEPDRAAMGLESPPPTSSRADGPRTGVARIHWPIVRVGPKSWGVRDVAILELEGIALLRGCKEVTEEMLNPEGRASIGNPGDRILWSDVTSIRVKRVGYLGPTSLWLRFEVRTVRGVRKFRVPTREATPVVDALQTLAGDRFRERPTRRFSGFEWILIVLSLSTVILAVLGAVSIGSVGLLLGVFPLFFVVTAIPFSLLDRRASEYALDPNPRRRRQVTPGRRPYRSPVLGWGLKVVGILYLAGILTASASVAEFGKVMSNVYAAIFLSVPALIALSVGYRLCLKTFEPQEHPDPRPPILFLRAFDDDSKKTFQPTNWLASLHGIFSYRDIFTLRKLGRVDIVQGF